VEDMLAFAADRAGTIGAVRPDDQWYSTTVEGSTINGWPSYFTPFDKLVSTGRVRSGETHCVRGVPVGENVCFHLCADIKGAEWSDMGPKRLAYYSKMTKAFDAYLCFDEPVSFTTQSKRVLMHTIDYASSDGSKRSTAFHFGYGTITLISDGPIVRTVLCKFENRRDMLLPDTLAFVGALQVWAVSSYTGTVTFTASAGADVDDLQSLLKVKTRQCRGVVDRLAGELIYDAGKGEFCSVDKTGVVSYGVCESGNMPANSMAIYASPYLHELGGSTLMLIDELSGGSLLVSTTDTRGSRINYLRDAECNVPYDIDHPTAEKQVTITHACEIKAANAIVPTRVTAACKTDGMVVVMESANVPQAKKRLRGLVEASGAAHTTTDEGVRLGNGSEIRVEYTAGMVGESSDDHFADSLCSTDTMTMAASTAGVRDPNRYKVLAGDDTLIVDNIRDPRCVVHVSSRRANRVDCLSSPTRLGRSTELAALVKVALSSAVAVIDLDATQAEKYPSAMIKEHGEAVMKYVHGVLRRCSRVKLVVDVAARRPGVKGALAHKWHSAILHVPVHMVDRKQAESHGKRIRMVTVVR
jgi:hypothetical protein